MSKFEKKIINSLCCDSRYKKYIKKFMKKYKLDLTYTLNFVFYIFFSQTNEKILKSDKKEH